MIRPVAADGRIETGGAFTPIHRPRVVERIQSAATQRIVLIIAPAGYGKSVALREYLSTLHETHVRYDVREDHSTLLGFVRGFADAVHEIAPDARKTASTAYEKSCSSKTPGGDLAMWMHAHIKTFSGVIAIDDLHIGESDPEITKFIVSLIQRTQGRTRWVIASRSTLDLPVGSWLAYGEMDLNVDEQDLRFTLDEARQAAKASKVGVRDEELTDILSMTEGWPTALSFALRSSTRSIDLRNISANTREMVYRYLAEQVYQTLGDDERDLLHFIGYLPEIDLEVLRSAGYKKARAIVESLRDRVAFIYPDRPGVYRCHDLFRAFLQHQLELEGDAAVAAMRCRVAEALEVVNKPEAALSIYADAGSDSDILRLLESRGFALVEQAHEDVVSAAVDALPYETRASHPTILALRAAKEANAGRFDRAESLFGRAIGHSKDCALSAELSARLSVILFNQGKDIIALLEPLLNLNLREAAKANIVSWLAAAYAIGGRVEDAEKAIAETELFASTVESDELRARLFHRLGIASMALKMPLERVESYYSRAQSLAASQGVYVVSAVALGGLATAFALYEDDVTKYAWYAQQAINAASKAGDRFSMQTSLLQLINAEARRGNAERLPALEQQFASVTTSDTSRLFYIVPARAMISAWHGNFEEAYRQISTVADRSFYSFDRAFNGAIQSIYAVACGEKERAVEISARVIDDIAEQDFDYLYGQRQAEISRLMCAIAQALSGRVAVAARILARRPITDGPPISAVRDAAVAIVRACRTSAGDEVDEALANLHSVGYGGIARVLQGTVLRCLSEQSESEIALTPSERIVLAALAQGQSPKDIALETGRSVYTVQAHIQNVIKKLGCSGRHEALTVARKKGLVG